MRRDFSVLTLDPHSLLFEAGLVVFILAIAFYTRVPDHSSFGPARLVRKALREKGWKEFARCARRSGKEGSATVSRNKA